MDLSLVIKNNADSKKAFNLVDIGHRIRHHGDRLLGPPTIGLDLDLLQEM
jgi:hypothetical protein